ncbi:hypothetical protein GCM10027614_44450 [Micromonospora vulcania]
MPAPGWSGPSLWPDQEWYDRPGRRVLVADHVRGRPGGDSAHAALAVPGCGAADERLGRAGSHVPDVRAR